MPSPRQATLACAASAAHRNPREQEAEVFRRANAALRRAVDGTQLARSRALADNARLWNAVGGLVRDPDNGLPVALRASIASIGLAVEREMRKAAPDWQFLLSINESLAAGLEGRAP